LCLLFVSTGIALSQQSVFVRVLNMVTGPTVSPIVRNIGQASHQVTIYVTNTSGTCGGSGQLEYSYDGITFVPFTGSEAVVPFSVATPGLSTFLVSGQGVYPQIRFNLTSFSGGVCTLTAQYTGAPAASGALQTVGQTSVFAQPFNLFSGPTSAVATVPTGGQNFHQLFGFLGNNGANTCGQADGWHIILYGLPASNSVAPAGNLIDQFILQGSPGPGKAFGPFFGLGNFPIYNVDLFAQGMGNVNCTLSLWYSGVANGPVMPTSSSTNPSSPIEQCQSQRNINVAAGATSVIVPFSSGSTILVCQMILTTATAGTTANIRFGTSGTNCGTIQQTVGTYSMAVGVPVTLGGGLGFALAAQVNTDLCLSATTNAITGSVFYDYGALPPGPASGSSP
jgi:hypothetical protein